MKSNGELLSRFGSKDEVKRHICENIDSFHRYEGGNIIKGLESMSEGEYSIYDIITNNSKKKCIHCGDGLESYNDILTDLETQRSVAELLGNGELANLFAQEKWNAMESAKTDDIGVNLKKYYAKGYNLLEKVLNRLEMTEHVCYNDCIHNLVNEKNAVSIVRALDVLSETDEFIANLVDGDIQTNSIALPSINGIPLAGNAAFGDFFRKAGKSIKKVIGDVFDFGVNGVKKGVQKIIDTPRDAYELGKKTAGKVYDFGKEKLNNIGDGARSLVSKGLDRFANVSDNEVFSSFAKNLAEDLRNYDIDNTDVDKVRKSNYISNYKGNITVKNDLNKIDLPSKDKKIGGTFAIGNVIALANNLDDKKFEDTLNHEYGHTEQFDNLGAIRYMTDVAFPSMDGYLNNTGEYYLQPWENSADELGGVEREFKDVDRDAIENVGEEKNWLSPYTWLDSLSEEIDSWN